jgi:hypothetical protein
MLQGSPFGKPHSSSSAKQIDDRHEPAVAQV